MTSQVRTALLSVILTLSGILTLTAYADADGGCFQGTYFVRESSGTQSLWTFHKMVLIKAPARRKWLAVLVTYRVPGKRPGIENCARQV